MPSPTVAVLRNDTPLILLAAAPETSLAGARKQLREQGLILDSDRFVDRSGFPVPQGKEEDWTIQALLARSDDQTIRLKSTEREVKKSALARLADAAAKAEAPEIPKAPELV